MKLCWFMHELVRTHARGGRCRSLVCGLVLFTATWAGAQSNPGGGGSAPPPPSPPPPPQSQPYIPLNQPLPPPADPHARTNYAVEQQLRDWRKAHPLRIFFPPNPPPLGVEVILPPDAYVRGAPPPDVVADVAEPYFPALSTRAVDPLLRLRKTTSRRLESYRAQRDTLLESLRQTLDQHAGSHADARRAALESLAQAQADDLARLESQAEKLRAELADGVSWSDLRTWRLDSGDLAGLREENRFLEYQVLRAAAFYESGFEPAQRRLLFEAAQILEGKVFAPPDAVDAMPLFPFFSPDLLRVSLPADAPAPAVAAMERFLAHKAALRDELRDAVYAHDAKADSVRRRIWQRLAKSQEPALVALAGMADEVRRELALMRDRSWRATPPPPLPDGVASDIQQYLAQRHALQREIEEYINASLAEAVGSPTELKTTPKAELVERRRRLIQTATDRFMQSHTTELKALAEAAEAIAVLLQSELPASERYQSGDRAEEWLMELLQRRQHATATHEFDLAAFEPGLAPAQRRLLFRAACSRLGLPVVGPELQPVDAPKTILR